MLAYYSPALSRWGLGMLMIMLTESSESGRSYRLEGKLLGPWVDELSRACEEPETPPSGLRLDLSAVTFIDSAGAELARRLDPARERASSGARASSRRC